MEEDLLFVNCYLIRRALVEIESLTCRYILKSKEAKLYLETYARRRLGEGAPKSLMNHLLLFIAASDILNCVSPWLYQTQTFFGVWTEIVFSSSNVKMCGCLPLTSFFYQDHSRSVGLCYVRIGLHSDSDRTFHISRTMLRTYRTTFRQW